MLFAVNFKKAITLLLVFSLIILTACSPLETVKSFFSDDGSGHIFKMSLSSDPVTLDPQLAQDENSVQVAKNTFVGLLRSNGDGSIVPGAAKDYDVSEDGLIYTFHLYEDWQWKAAGGYTSELTARDFAYGFRRLFDPATASPFASDYYCIRNSKAVNTGRMELDELGVRAIDNYTLEIALDYKNAEFLRLLTYLAASPCNQDFFEGCRGKYGLEAECIASNGPFYVRYWLHDEYGKDNYVRLRKNDSYALADEVSPAGVNFLIEKDGKTRREDFLAGTTDCIVADSFLEIGEGFSIKTVYANSIGLIINPSETILSRTEVREALSLCIDLEEAAEELPDYLTAADGLISDTAFIGALKYSDISGAEKPESNPRLAEYRWSFLLDDNEKLSICGKNILIPESFADYEYLSLITKMWSDSLQYNVGLEVVNDREYISRLQRGEYSICLAVISGVRSSAIDYILPFCDGSMGFVTDYCEDAVVACEKGGTAEANAEICCSCEERLLYEYLYIPLWYSPVFVASGEDCTDIDYDVFSGAVLFDNAKHF